jgi:hypothetical protein
MVVSPFSLTESISGMGLPHCCVHRVIVADADGVPERQRVDCVEERYDIASEQMHVKARRVQRELNP